MATLVAVTLIWGTTFSVTKFSLADIPPLYFLAWRFSIASVVLIVVNFRRLASVSRTELTGGLLLGASMAAGYIAQTVGMVYSTAAKAGFITGLAVVLVPLLGAVLYHRRPKVPVYIFAAVAAWGLALLSLDFSAGLGVNRGDFYLFLCAAAFAVNILNLARYAPRCRILLLTMIQVAITAFICWTATLLLEEPVTFAGPVWTGLIYLATVATVLTTVGQAWGQSLVSPERAALVFTLEPVFAAVFAVLLLGESLPPEGILGSILIMVGIVGAEVLPRKGKQRAME